MVSWSDDVPLGMVPPKRYAPMPRPCRRGAKSSPRRDCSSGFRRSRIQLSITRQRLRNSSLSARANGGRGMAVAALPDGRRAQSASADKTLKLWDLETGNPLAVGPTQMQSAWCARLQDIELMPQYRDFGFQPPPRLEAVAQHADEKEGNCNH